MNQFEWLSLVISSLGILIVAGGLYFTYKQIRLVSEQIKLTVDQARLFTDQTKLLAEQSRILLETHSDNHEWNRRSFTQDVLMSFTLGKHVNELSNVIDQDRTSPIPLQELQELFQSNPHLQTECHTLLNFYESLARGIKFGIYDEEIIKVARHGLMRRTYVIFIEYINLWRSRMDNSWSEFEALVKRWAKQNQVGLEGRPVTGKPVTIDK